MKIAGLKVVDATKKLKIQVTKQDVDRGDTKDPGACAAARACIRAGFSQARVHLGRVYLKDDKKWTRYQTPETLRSEIIAFDRGGTFLPGDHELRPMPPSYRAKVGRAQGSARSKTKPRPKIAKRRTPHVIAGVRERGANR